MCGRFSFAIDESELMLRFYVESFEMYRPRYNIAPGQDIIAVIHDGSKNRIGTLKWGLIPYWAKDRKIANHLINARAETVDEKPAFRLPFQRKRCLIPADGFYEWMKTPNGKQPMRITLKDKGMFAMAGLYDTWIDPDGQKWSTCTIITTSANDLMKPIHDRMPVILRKEDESLWLDRSVQDTEQLKPLLVPYDPDLMTAYKVSPIVGNVRNDVPECIAPMEDETAK